MSSACRENHTSQRHAQSIDDNSTLASPPFCTNLYIAQDNQQQPIAPQRINASPFWRQTSLATTSHHQWEGLNLRLLDTEILSTFA